MCSFVQVLVMAIGKGEMREKIENSTDEDLQTVSTVNVMERV